MFIICLSLLYKLPGVFFLKQLKVWEALVLVFPVGKCFYISSLSLILTLSWQSKYYELLTFVVV